MLHLRVDCVLLADSCFDKHDPMLSHTADLVRRLSRRRVLVVAVDVSGAGALDATLTRLGLDCACVAPGPAGPAHEAVHAELTRHGIRPEATVAIGVLESDLELRHAAAVYLHAGPAEALPRKVRNVVPLTGQFGAGVSNALELLARADAPIDLLQHADLVAFADRTRERYAAPDAGVPLHEKAVSAARFIQRSLADDVAGVFGTGYPFYASGPGTPPPPSVRSYFDQQATYFRSRCMPDADFERDASACFSRDELPRAVGIPAERNRFDAYLFESRAQAVPRPPPGPHELREYLEHNCFDVAGDVWPCQLCTALQSRESFPRQRVLKNTNSDCLGCAQTSLMVRNVMGVAPDVDLIVVVDGDADDVAERMKRLLIEDRTYHLFDLEVKRAIIDDDGPLDVFVFELDAMLRALRRLRTRDWQGTAIPTVALWCPTEHLDGRLDLCFPLAFEPIVISDVRLRRGYEATRREFGGGATANEIIGFLGEGSDWTQQLMTNPVLVEAVRARFDDRAS